MLRSRLPGLRVRVYTPEPPQDADPALAEFVSGPDPLAHLRDREVVVRSPGVSIHRPDVAALREAGVTMTTGTNLWFAEMGASAPVAVITGTKGKSTTASLAAHLAVAAGVRTQLAGNVGTPLLSLLAGPAAELYVVELSSYQTADLDWTPALAVVLNLYREHLDWHGDEQRYYDDKLRILSGPGAVIAVLNAQDPRLRAWAGDRSGVRWFGDERGTHVGDGAFRDAGGRELARVGDLPLAGAHNLLNACGALEALRALGIDGGDRIASALRSFRSLRHRLEEVTRADGRIWIDDSISTTPESAIAALRSFPGRHVTLIAGGFDRGQDYDTLAAALIAHEPGVAVVAVAHTGPRLVASLAAAGAAIATTQTAESLDAAVRAAARATPPGGVVLLSPAAPSYGVYRDFEQRGEHFRRLALAAADGGLEIG